MDSSRHSGSQSQKQREQDPPVDESTLVAQWTRQIGKIEVMCQAGVTVDGTWTFKVWLAPLPTSDPLPPPDLVFPTLLKDRQHAQRLMEMSLVDEISARTGQPRPFIDGAKAEQAASAGSSGSAAHHCSSGAGGEDGGEGGDGSSSSFNAAARPPARR